MSARKAFLLRLPPELHAVEGHAGVAGRDHAIERDLHVEAGPGQERGENAVSSHGRHGSAPP